MYRIGVLSLTPFENTTLATVTTQGLSRLGYVVDRNVVVEDKFADGKVERLPALAAELVRLNVDVIVAGHTSALRAARDATATIPIVMSFIGEDPVKIGFVTSLAPFKLAVNMKTANALGLTIPRSVLQRADV